MKTENGAQYNWPSLATAAILTKSESFQSLNTYGSCENSTKNQAVEMEEGDDESRRFGCLHLETRLLI